jgi:hypothetical protein
MSSPARRLLVASFALMLVAPAAHADFGRDPYNPVVVSPVGAGKHFGTAISDGAGGMLVCWTDPVAGASDVYLLRYTSTGAIAPGWPAGGVRVCSAAGAESSPRVVSDGAGGGIVAWEDSRGTNTDIYAARILANGSLASGWPATGLLLSNSSVSPTNPDRSIAMIPDGAGGAFAAWTVEYTSADYDLYGAHVTAAGSITWSRALLQPFGHQDRAHLLPDGAGGFYLAFDDDEAGTVRKGKVQRYLSNGTSAWTPRTIGFGGQQFGLDLASDGGTGVYTVCADAWPGTFNTITGNHFLANGTNEPLWGTGRSLAFVANDDQETPMIAPDGAGGFILAFEDFRSGTGAVYALRIAPDGSAYFGWPLTGVGLATGSTAFTLSSMAADGSGGAIVSFYDASISAYHLSASRILGDASSAPGWTAGGSPVQLSGLTDPGFGHAATVPDASGGAMFAWSDKHGSLAPADQGVFAQNVDGFGAYGDARPYITSVADVPNDQGGAISLQWTASYLDAMPARTVAQYSIWRRVPSGARAGPAAARRPIRTSVQGTQVLYWEYVASEPARMLPGYSLVVATTSDSIPTSNPLTSYQVMAESAGGAEFWISPADSGYSVDNLPPLAPAPFSGTYAAGVTSLHWSPVVAPDLAGYRLYRGGTASFTPDPSNRLASLTDTSYTDAAGAPYFYRLTAADIHGNESPSLLLLPEGTLGADEGLPTEVAFAPPSPNPARGSASMRFALPKAGAARLAIFDVNGRRVRTLLDGAQDAGEHALTWDLRDEQGRAVNAGLYLARFEASGRVITRRVMALR